MCFVSREKAVGGYAIDSPVDSVICCRLCCSTISAVSVDRSTERASVVSFVDDVVWVPFV